MDPSNAAVNFGIQVADQVGEAAPGVGQVRR